MCAAHYSLYVARRAGHWSVGTRHGGLDPRVGRLFQGRRLIWDSFRKMLEMQQGAARDSRLHKGRDSTSKLADPQLSAKRENDKGTGTQA